MKSIAALARQTDSEGRLNSAPPAAVNITAVVGSKVSAVLLLDTPLGKGGTPVTLEQNSSSGGLSLNEIVNGGTRGNREIPRSGVGDVLVFEHGILTGNILTVGRLGARVHEGMEEGVQVARLLAKPSRSKISKYGATQYATLVDPSVSTIVHNADEFRTVANRELSRDWPGGRPGLMLRHGRHHVDIMADEIEGPKGARSYEKVADFVERQITDNDVMSGGAFEIIPIWSLPMGREQVIRDIGDPNAERAPAVGRFVPLYGKNGPAFQPSVVILGDEEEWAFGAPTGRSRRVVLGMHPIRFDFGMQLDQLPSPSFDNRIVPPIKYLYKEPADVERAAMERRNRATARQDAAAKREAELAAAIPAPSSFRGFVRR